MRNWKNSEAHILLLSKFLKPESPSKYIDSESWKEILKEKPLKAIKRFIREGCLIEAELKDRLDHKFTVRELKSILKDKGIQASGKKLDLINELILTNESYAKRISDNVEVYICSSAITPLLKNYLDTKRTEEEILVKSVIESIEANSYEKACHLVADYNAKQFFPKGINHDWENYNHTHDVQVLNEIFNHTPKRLLDLPKEKIHVLKIAAALKHLFDESTVRDYLPDDFNVDLDINFQTALNLFWIRAMRQASIENYRKNKDILIGVEIVCVENACDECRKLSGITYSFDEDIPIPDDFCTNKKGCRCVYIPKVIYKPK